MKRNNLRGKLMVFYVFIAVLPTFILFVFYMRSYIGILEENINNTVLQTLKQAGINISYMLENAKRISDTVFANETVISALNTSPKNQTIDDMIQEMTDLRKVLSTVHNMQDIRSLRLFVNDEKIYSGEKTFFYTFSGFQKNEVYDGITGRGAFLKINDLSYIGNVRANVVSFSRLMINPNRFGEVIGALSVDIDENKINDLLTQMDFSENYNVYIQDANGNILFEKSGEQMPRLKDVGNISSDYSIINSGAYLYIIKRIEVADWYLVASIPKNQIRLNYFAKGANVLLYLVLAVIFLGAMLILSTFLVDGAVRRISQLVTVFSNSNEVNISIPKTSNSIFDVYKSIDMTLDSVKSLLGDYYRQTELQKETQLKLLQAQINPHFIYNTLDSILWSVRLNEMEQSEHIISLLSSYLRLILNNGRDVVSVSDEIALAEAFIGIQRHRFSDAFDVEFVTEPNALNAQIPKLSLQPIIENALKHGLQKDSTRRGKIDVDIYTDERALYLSVTDNGAGMSDERIKEVFTGGYTSGYGLYNVCRRIILFSGSNAYGISIESEIDKFTTVTLKVALRHDK